ncbi:MAG: 7-cyano-7-deazaguanine synthase [Pseudomonadota bacterium]
MNRCLLISGGVDSIALAYWLRPEYALTVDYGQKAALAEVDAAREVCAMLSIPHQVVSVDYSDLGIGSMAPHGKEVRREDGFCAPSPEWWPFRNQHLVTIAASKCILSGCSEVILGTVKSDQVSHLDGTEEFVRKLSDLLSIQEGGIRLVAPAISMSSSELVLVSKVPMSVLRWAHSCHQANNPCCACRGCVKYFEVMETVAAVTHQTVA